MIIFGLNIACNIYMNMDKTMLGFLKNDAEVGLYTAAYKVNTILLSFVNAVGAVLLPRMSYHFANGAHKEYKDLLRMSFNYILLLSMPMVCGLIFLSKPIIILFSGGEYIDAVPTMQILSLIILISGMGTTLSTQYFAVRGKEKVCLFASSCAAFVNFTLNILLIPKLGHVGAAIATVICEIVALIVLTMVMKRETQIRDLFRDVFSYIFASVGMIPFLVIINTFISAEIPRVILSVGAGTVIYFAVLVLFKNKYLISFVDEIKGKLKRQG
jgi:O-antigen/teichoic acid export membrane protein